MNNPKKEYQFKVNINKNRLNIKVKLENCVYKYLKPRHRYYNYKEI